VAQDVDNFNPNYYVGLATFNRGVSSVTHEGYFQNFYVNASNGTPALVSDTFTTDMLSWSPIKGIGGTQVEDTNALTIFPYEGLGPAPGVTDDTMARYVYQPSCAYFYEAIVAVPNLTTATAGISAVGGLAFRDGTDSNAREVALRVYHPLGNLALRGIYFDYRTATGGTVTRMGGMPTVADASNQYLRLAKWGNDWYGFIGDGTNWTYLGGLTLPMGCYNVGLMGSGTFNSINNNPPSFTSRPRSRKVL
jgi:hypothetical protein